METKSKPTLRHENLHQSTLLIIYIVILIELLVKFFESQLITPEGRSKGYPSRAILHSKNTIPRKNLDLTKQQLTKTNVFPICLPTYLRDLSGSFYLLQRALQALDKLYIHLLLTLHTSPESIRMRIQQSQNILSIPYYIIYMLCYFLSIYIILSQPLLQRPYGALQEVNSHYILTKQI